MTVLAVVLGALGATASSASAGTYSLQLSGPALCSAGVFETNASGFGGTCQPNNSGTDEVFLSAPTTQSNAGDRELFEINSPSSALSIVGSSVSGAEATFNSGYGAGAYWTGGGQPYSSVGDPASGFASPYWGYQIFCGDANYCEAPSGNDIIPYVDFSGVNLTVSEAQSPALSASGLWGQTGYVWNAAGDPWVVNLAGGDPSGICGFSLYIDGGVPLQDVESHDVASWQQCPTPLTDDVSVSTAQYVPTAGALSLAATAVDAANNSTSSQTSVKVDNIDPTISISQLNDNASTGAGNDAPAELQITPTTGPSGVSSVGCTVDGQPYQLTGPDAQGNYSLPVDDSTNHTVVCSVANNAVNPQGQHNTATATATVRAYDASAISFQKIVDPLRRRRVKERVRVDYHYAIRRLKSGRKVRVKVGGHIVMRTITRYVEHCSTRTVRVRGKLTRRRVCFKPSTRYQQALLLGHGKTTTIYGQLIGGQGGGLAGQSVTILSSPLNGSASATTVAVATTNATGGWSATIPAGPSRTITAQYGGTGTQLPSSASATVSVPAEIHLSIGPRRLPWGAPMTLTGRLLGGNVPTDGVAMRLLIKIPGLAKPYAGPSFRTTPSGTFKLRYIAPRIFTTPKTLPIAVGMVGPEDNYPFLPSRSAYVKVLLGVRTPTDRHHRHRTDRHDRTKR